MTRPTDDLSQDPFASDDLPQDQTFTDNMRDVAVDQVKTAASNYVRQAPKRMGRRFIWSIILSFTFVGRYQKERLLDRIEAGERITFYEALFGTKFRLFSLIRLIIFFAILGGFAYYFWQNDMFATLMEQQALLESLQGTPSP